VVKALCYKPEGRGFENRLGERIFIFSLLKTRVETGKDTSAVIPASRKRRRKGNPVVSGETVPADLREGS
jgi:hypothetical protein